MKTKNSSSRILSALMLGLGTLALPSCDKTYGLNAEQESLEPSTRLMATTTGAGLIFHSTFEQQDALNGTYWGRESANLNSITRTSSPARSGAYSAKVILSNTDPIVAGSYRAELKKDPLPPFAERWYGFSTYLPSSYTIDPVPESIFQWHNIPNFSSGETWAMPTRGGGIRATPLHVETVNGRYVLVHAYSSIPSDYKSPSVVKKYDLGAYKTGEWTDWVIHLRLTYQSDGLIELWKNGQKVLTINGTTYYNDESGPYFKMGLYKWGWSGNESRVSSRTIYYDEVKIGNQNSSYSEVAPSSNTTPAPTPPENTPSPAPTNSVVFALNGGDGAFTASNGITYLSDRNYSGGFSHSVGTAIPNTVDDRLFQFGHYGTRFAYKIPLADGTYDITFSFIENYNNSSNQRLFDVSSEGVKIISSLDIFSLVGKNRVYYLTKTLKVADGTLDLDFTGLRGDAMVSAFHIIKKY